MAPAVSMWNRLVHFQYGDHGQVSRKKKLYLRIP